jgi:hypothetical protein
MAGDMRGEDDALFLESGFGAEGLKDRKDPGSVNLNGFGAGCSSSSSSAQEARFFFGGASEPVARVGKSSLLLVIFAGGGATAT